MLRTVLANISRRKLRMLGTSLAVLLGVMFTSGTLVLTDCGELAEADLASIRKISGVATAEGDLLGYTQIIKKNGKALGNPNQGAPTMGGNWLDDPALNPYQIVTGRAPRTADEIVIDRASAKTTGYVVGDRIPLLTPSGRITRTVVGIAKFGDADGPGGASAVSFTTAEAQRVLGRVGKFDEVRIAAEPGISEAQVTAKVRAANLPSVEVVTGTKAADEARKAATAFLSFFSVFLLIFAAIALLVGAFIIANTFSILVAQRTRELALLRAIGASRRQVLMSVVAEAFVVGVLASAVGLGLGFLIATGLQKLLMGNSGLAGSATLSTRTVLLSFLIGIGITVLSALLPARRAARVAPVTAMREAAVEDVSRGRIRAVIGFVLLVLTAALLIAGAAVDSAKLVGVGAVAGLAGAVVFGPVLASWLARGAGRPLRSRGMAGVLGQQNVLRNPKRTASTASALMIGATLVCAITIFAASALASINNLVDTRFNGAVVVSSTGNGLPLNDVKALQDDPALGTVAAMFFAPVTIDGTGTLVAASDPQALEKMVDMETVAGDVGTLGVDDVAVSEAKAMDKGWKLGTKIEASFLDGSTRSLTVRAIYRNTLIAQNVFTNVTAVQDSLIVPFAQVAFISGKPGVSPKALKVQVDKLLKDNPTAKVQTNAEFKASSAAQMDAFLNIVYAMLALAVIIAIIGIVNTLALSIMERTREIGLLRAVGMTRRQIRTMVRIEALLIALTGTIIGIALGTAIGAALMKSFGPEQALTGFDIPVVRLVIVLVAGVVVGFVAAILPARRAARLNPLEALATE